MALIKNSALQDSQQNPVRHCFALMICKIWKLNQFRIFKFLFVKFLNFKWKLHVVSFVTCQPSQLNINTTDSFSFIYTKLFITLIPSPLPLFTPLIPISPHPGYSPDSYLPFPWLLPRFLSQLPLVTPQISIFPPGYSPDFYLTSQF